MYRFVLVIFIFNMAINCVGESSFREMHVTDLDHHGLIIEATEAGGTYTFTITWDEIFSTIVDRKDTLGIIPPGKTSPEVNFLYRAMDTLLSIPTYAAVDLTIIDGDNNTVSTIPLCPRNPKEPGFRFTIAEEYTTYSKFLITWQDWPSFDVYWFNLGKMYRELNERKEKGDE